MYTAETLRQAEGAGVVDGFLIGGDTSFGSSTSCVEIRNKFKAHSTLIVKIMQV